jgi:hypothetical protein
VLEKKITSREKKQNKTKKGRGRNCREMILLKVIIQSNYPRSDGSLKPPILTRFKE